MRSLALISKVPLEQQGILLNFCGEHASHGHDLVWWAAALLSLGVVFLFPKWRKSRKTRCN